MSSAGVNQRSVHITYIQQEILQFLHPSNTHRLDLNVPARLSREERGLASHITARFLVPRQHLDAFEEDPDGYVTSSPLPQDSPHTQDHCKAPEQQRHKLRTDRQGVANIPLQQTGWVEQLQH